MVRSRRWAGRGRSDDRQMTDELDLALFEAFQITLMMTVAGQDDFGNATSGTSDGDLRRSLNQPHILPSGQWHWHSKPGMPATPSLPYTCINHSLSNPTFDGFFFPVFPQHHGSPPLPYLQREGENFRPPLPHICLPPQLPDPIHFKSILPPFLCIFDSSIMSMPCHQSLGG